MYLQIELKNNSNMLLQMKIKLNKNLYKESLISIINELIKLISREKEYLFLFFLYFTNLFFIFNLRIT